MLNYLRAEIYKFLHRKYFWITLTIVLALEGLLIFGYSFTNSHGNNIDAAWAISTLFPMMGLGCFFTLLTGDMVFAQQYKHNTLKNEVSFGLPRSRIYLGKLLVQLFASVLMCFIMILFYVIGCRLFLLPNTEEANQAVLLCLGQCLLGALPIWVGVQATVCACYFLIRSEIGSSFAAVGLFGLSANVLELAVLFLRKYPVSEVLWKIYQHMPLVLLDDLPNTLMKPEYWPCLGKLCVVGGAWFIGSTAIGLWRFDKKEIN